MINITNGYSEQIRQNIINQTPTFSNFSKTLELGIHGLYHSKLTYTMNTIYSPNDPVFFLHHGFIDRLWNEWQNKNGNLFDSELYSNKDFTLDSLLPYFNISVRNALNMTCMNYTNTVFINNITNIIPEQPSLNFLKINNFTRKEISDNILFNLQISNNSNRINVSFFILFFFIVLT